ncbi:hypothetical protein [Niallia taxi]|uniref:hypothetical protein n=1 Tax=Niallia taxi TaxID=2499688 RepID=UPI0030094F7C
MVSIFEAYYIDENEKLLLTVEDVTPEEYSNKYWGKLFCTEPDCTAKLSYVNKPGNKSLFRKWRDSPHSRSCMYFSDRVEGRLGNRQSAVQSGIISPEQIIRAQREAFALEMMSEDERIKRREADREKRKNRNNKKVTNIEEKPAIKVVVDPAKKSQTDEQVKGRLYKRDVDGLKEKDLGETRTITGRVVKVETANKHALVRVVKNGTFVNIVYGQAFFANVPQYEGLFHYIDRFAKENNNAIFSGTGEVRKNEQTDEFELFVFDRDGLMIQGKSLPALAAYYSITAPDTNNIDE